MSDAALLQLMWLASPALPVGGFSYSEGLESAVECGALNDVEQVRVWLLDQLHLVVARSELPLVARAFDAWCRHDAVAIAGLNAWLMQTRESAEARGQTAQMGRSMVEWLRNHDGAGANADADPRIAELAALALAPGWPIAFALAAARSGAPVRQALLAYAFGWCETMVQAALKSVPLGQRAGQRVLAALTDAVPGVVVHAMSLDDDARQAYAPMLAVLAAQHETQYSRLFRS